MIDLKSVTKPTSTSPFESLEAEPPAPRSTPGSPGTATDEVSRSLRHLAARGKSGPILPPFETVIDRVLAPDIMGEPS